MIPNCFFGMSTVDQKRGVNDTNLIFLVCQPLTKTEESMTPIRFFGMSTLDQKRGVNDTNLTFVCVNPGPKKRSQ